MILRNGIFYADLLSDLPVIHGFTTRAWGNLGYGKIPGDPEVTAGRKKLFDSLSLKDRNHVQPRQIHSGRCIRADEFQSGIEADAEYSGFRQDLLSVLTADCVPILMYHPDGLVAAVHAGWRGLKNGIIPNTLAQLPAGPVAAIGPAIGPCCYEVNEDLSEYFRQAYGSDVIHAIEGNKPRIDLVAVATLQLRQAGVREIEISHLCTFCHPDLFFSYRRDGSSGRMMSFIGLR